MATSANNKGSQTTTMSMEALLLDFYLQSLRDFSAIWLNHSESGVPTAIYNMQFLYLVQSIPSETIRKKIWKAQKEAEERLKEEGNPSPYEVSCMVAVAGVMEFLASTFDLLHEDILGPATSKQYRDAILEIPDIEPTPEKKQDQAPELPRSTSTDTVTSPSSVVQEPSNV